MKKNHLPGVNFTFNAKLIRVRADPKSVKIKSSRQ